MSILQKTKKAQVFVDYVPAELRENKVWEVVYYVKNPITQELERKRNRVKPLKSIIDRRKLGKRMVKEINQRLENDVKSFFNANGSRELSTFKQATDVFIKRIKKEYKDKNLSKDTYRTYFSRVENIMAYLELKGKTDLICYNFNNELIHNFLDYLRYEKDLKARTRDNYFTFIRTLCTWMLQKKYILSNPCEGIKKINKKKPEKEVINEKDRERIFEYYKNSNINFLVFCLTCYYCLIRRTELSKLKVKDVNLKQRTLWISADDSKNNKSSLVTIPPILCKYLAIHIKNSNEEDFLFSNDNYKPGQENFKPNKATSNWSRMRKKLNLNKSIKWYHLKDSGIVDLIIAGVPLNSIRDQARHHSISQTNDYIPRNMKNADNYILSANVSFTNSQTS